MKKKLLVSLLSSLGILIVGIGAAYAAYTFKANQEGSRQGGEAQASRLTMRVEAGVADGSAFIPDDPAISTSLNPGGALNFAIKNTSDLPLRVTNISLATQACGTKTCYGITSNKNGDGTYVSGSFLGTGDCGQYVTFAPPSNFDNWPIIGAHSTLQVNGTDNSRLGAGMIHLTYSTAQGCQGANFALTLNVTAQEATQAPGTFILP
jgi:type II secretory pathway pseudopilin PulG